MRSLANKIRVCELNYTAVRTRHLHGASVLHDGFFTDIKYDRMCFYSH